MRRQVIAVFTVETEDPGAWSPSDIALYIEESGAFTNATVWDSVEDFDADRNCDLFIPSAPGEH